LLTPAVKAGASTPSTPRTAPLFTAYCAVNNLVNAVKILISFLRGDMCRRLGRIPEARASYEKALAPSAAGTGAAIPARADSAIEIKSGNRERPVGPRSSSEPRFCTLRAATPSPTEKGDTSNCIRYCIALKNALFFRQPSGVELRPIFDKRAISNQHSAVSQNRSGDPLPNLGWQWVTLGEIGST